jgi:hypothetical protein
MPKPDEVILPPFEWPQDKIRRPVHAISASEDPLLKTLDKAQYSYSWRMTIAAATEQSFVRNFVADMSSDFYLSSLAVQAFNTATQAPLLGSGIGYLSLTDNATGFTFVENLALCLACSSGSVQFGYKRTIWPLPYPIGAGGSFMATLVVPAGLSAEHAQELVFDGWKDYTFGASKSP